LIWKTGKSTLDLFSTLTWKGKSIKLDSTFTWKTGKSIKFDLFSTLTWKTGKSIGLDLKTGESTKLTFEDREIGA